MKIYLIRHGETTGDLEDRYGGDYDDHLSEKGQKQARELVQKLKNKNLEVILHSPRIRAAETAKILAQQLNVPLIVVNDLRERNAYGLLTGLIKSEAQKKYPQEVEKLKKDKLKPQVKGSEDYGSFKKRVVKAFAEVMGTNHPTIAIVSHGGPISCLVREVLQLGEFAYLGDCAILEIEKQGKKLSLVRLENAALSKPL